MKTLLIALIFMFSQSSYSIILDSCVSYFTNTYFTNFKISELDGLVDVSPPINTTSLLEAYKLGIFPWYIENEKVHWFRPRERGVLFFKDLKINSRLQRYYKNTSFRFTMNKAFYDVIQNCANQARIENGKPSTTWIEPIYIQEYSKLHKMGYVHSVEVWDGAELVGGLYGVLVNGVFAGESMFHKKSNASKFAILYLIERLKEKGFTWIDTQMVTEVVKDLGGKYILRDEHLELLEARKKQNKTERFYF